MQLEAWGCRSFTPTVRCNVRRTGAIDWQDGMVDILDWPLLRELGQFEPTYLHLEKLRLLAPRAQPRKNIANGRNWLDPPDNVGTHAPAMRSPF